MSVFKGAAVAIVTPMFDNGEVNYPKLGEIIEYQIAHKTDAIVICGTTGEASTLSHEEHIEVIDYCVKKVAKRVPVIAGTGSNSTETAIYLSQEAEKSGADALLVVTPYYNKATQKGLVKMFNQIAEVSTKPIILYNVPSRTGVNITPATCKELAKNPKIVAIKEASGNMSQIAEIAALCGDDLDIYSGNDDQIVPVMSLGGKGVISVLSNLLPKETSAICHDFLNGNVKESRAKQLEYLDLINALFCEVNPIPVKAAMSYMGFCENYLRLPLTPMEEDNEKKLYALMEQAGIRRK